MEPSVLLVQIKKTFVLLIVVLRRGNMTQQVIRTNAGRWSLTSSHQLHANFTQDCGGERVGEIVSMFAISAKIPATIYGLFFLLNIPLSVSCLYIVLKLFTPVHPC